ncbi:hypothetical protein BKA61DRAFT_665846 [Leptodontidium sp. MPI-SDFR-AT-0119]|nr:hypothetical protein BKA61DRAFT_665846 [Leptodontidium sp. MPI-SDFR-AT-0119]
MTRRDTGLFAGFNLENTRSLRSLHWALDYWLKGGRATHLGALSKLSKIQRSTVEMVIQRMERSPLLQDIISTFLKLSREDSKALQTGGRDLELYAVTSTYEPKTYAYKEAEEGEAWKNRQPLGLSGNVDPNHQAVVDGFLEIFELEKAADEEYLRKIGYEPNIIDGIGYNSDDCSYSNSFEDESNDNDGDIAFPSPMPPVARDQARDKAGIRVARFASVVSQVKQQQRVPLVPIKHERANKGRMQSREATAGMATKTQNARRDLSEAFNRNLSLDCNTHMKPDEDVSDRISLQTRGVAQDPHRTKRIRTAKMMQGYIITNINDIDIEKAKLGVVDPSKLVLVFKTAKPDPSNAGQMVPGTSLNYSYSKTLNDFDWNNMEHIRALNNWRQQVFLRRLQTSRKPRQYWLVSERKALLELAETQLQTYGRLKWNLLADSFNNQNTGLTDGADEEVISHGLRLSSILGETRPKPWRTRYSLIALSKKDSQFEALFAKYNSSYVKTSSRKLKSKDSDTEDVDPAPGPQLRMDRKVLKANNGGSSESVARGIKRKRGGSDVENDVDIGSAWAASESESL